jgi:Transposase DDE domain
VARKALYLTRLRTSGKKRKGNGAGGWASRFARYRDGFGAVGTKKDILRALPVKSGNGPKVLEVGLIPLLHIGDCYLLRCRCVIRSPKKGHIINQGLRGDAADPAGKAFVATHRRWKHGNSCERVVCWHWSSACPRCPIKAQCTTGDYRRIARWEHEAVLEAMQARLEKMPDAARIRRQTAEHVLGTLKSWMGATHFLMKRLPNVRTEMSLHVLAYNLKRAMQVFGVVPLIQAIRA